MIYTSQINHYLTLWLGQPFPNRWMRNLLAEQEIYRYNTEDVIIVQEAVTHGSVYLILTGYCEVVRVYLILTGYCEVVRVEEGTREAVAMLQAGDVIGEMAILTGSGIRNASVVAKTPVTVCVFAEETFRNFIRHSGLQAMAAGDQAVAAVRRPVVHGNRQDLPHRRVEGRRGRQDHVARRGAYVYFRRGPWLD
jgi:CRP-like cAMP-binding protein